MSAQTDDKTYYLLKSDDFLRNRILELQILSPNDPSYYHNQITLIEQELNRRANR